MTITRRVLFPFVLFCCLGHSQAQTADSSQTREGTIRKMYTGAVRSLDWYDIPVATVDLAQLIFVSANSSSKPFKFPPTRFDTEFQPRVGVRGSQTFIGQIGDAGAAAFLGIRIAVNLGSDLLGGNVTSEDYHRTFWFYKSIVYTYSVTTLTKNLVDRTRPDGSDAGSFFSGHSSAAFCTASYVSRELHDWFDRWETTRTNDLLRSTLKIGSSVGLYAGAAYVAYTRMYDEKHYFSDVAVGAVVGTVVGTLMYQRHWNAEESAQQHFSLLVSHHTPILCYTIRF